MPCHGSFPFFWGPGQGGKLLAIAHFPFDFLGPGLLFFVPCHGSFPLFFGPGWGVGGGWVGILLFFAIAGTISFLGPPPPG